MANTFGREAVRTPSPFRPPEEGWGEGGAREFCWSDEGAKAVMSRYIRAEVPEKFVHLTLTPTLSLRERE